MRLAPAVGRFLCVYLKRITRNARIAVRGQRYLEQAQRSGRPMIVAAWHGLTMLVLAWLLRHEDARNWHIIVPDDFSGDTLIPFSQCIGSHPFTISMHDRSMGAGRRLLELTRTLRTGANLYLNPDGPYGPVRQPKPGVGLIAARAEAIVVPVGAFTRCLHVPRWDRYCLPWPSGRIALEVAPPLLGEKRGDREQLVAELGRRLSAAEARARRRYLLGSHMDT